MKYAVGQRVVIVKLNMDLLKCYVGTVAVIKKVSWRYDVETHDGRTLYLEEFKIRPAGMEVL